MAYNPSSFGYSPLTISDFGGQASVPTFQSIMGSSFPDLATTLNNLAISRRAPVLAEQGREFDVTSGMQQRSLEAQLQAMRQQLAEAQQRQAYLQAAMNDPFSHYQVVNSMFGGGGGGGGAYRQGTSGQSLIGGYAPQTTMLAGTSTPTYYDAYTGKYKPMTSLF